jgi:hypothetical protein
MKSAIRRPFQFRQRQVSASVIKNDDGQDIAKYVVIVAAILISVIGTNSNTVFSNVASTIQ